jgi:hypothetical protein
MSVKASGMGEMYGVPGLTFMLVFVALVIGTFNPGVFKGVPVLDGQGGTWSKIGVHLLALLLIFLAFWIGSQNADLLKDIPVVGKVLPD